jgi:CO/xanthine dehydrogenase FAD-binding subunit
MALFYRRLPHFNYIKPRTISDALAHLKEHKGAARLLAGGTDLVPQMKRREIPVPQYVIDLKGIPGLDAISFDAATGLKIGPLTTISAVACSPIVQEHYPILAQAALTMASPQIRNKGTFAGNICNAVSSADTVPSLLALQSTVSIAGPRGERTVPLDQFFIGPRRTALEADEMLLCIAVPAPEPGSRGVYLKLSPRHSMDLAVVGVAAVGSMENGMCKDMKIALGAVAPTAVRAKDAEGILYGRKISHGLIDEASRAAVDSCNPRVDSHRASPEYRRDMVYVLTRRAVRQVLGIG